MSAIFQYLRLCRLPTVFTALADISLGYFLTHARLDSVPQFMGLLGASAGLYLSGMVFNDYFDLSLDKGERPERPLPSGAIRPQAALTFACLLMLGGLLSAASVGWNSVAVGGLIAVCVLLYDAWLKRTSLGPLGMGLCRFLNVLLGASAAGERFAAVWQQPQLWVAASLGIYIVGVTLFARQEANVSSRMLLGVALLVVNLGLLGLAAWIMNWTAPLGFLIGFGGVEKPWTVLMLWGVITLTINRRAVAALFDPRPQLVQPTIGIMLLSLIMLDAMCIYFKLGTSGIPLAMGTVALLVPALALRRWIPLS